MISPFASDVKAFVLFHLPKKYLEGEKNHITPTLIWEKNRSFSYLKFDSAVILQRKEREDDSSILHTNFSQEMKT